MPTPDAPTVKLLKRGEEKISRFEEGKFQFAFRQFPRALETFEKLIAGYPKNGLTTMELMDALAYTATIYARIARDPRGGQKVFHRIVKRGNLPEFIQADVEGWEQSFAGWKKETPFELKEKPDAEILAKAKEILGGIMAEPFYARDRSNHVDYLRASGLLHEFVVGRPASPHAAEAYYLLGICYLTLDQDFYLGFDTLYFKSCIVEFPRSPIARRCYRRLEEAIILGYSGSSGTHIPPDVESELNRLRSLLR
jgi:hypothetical protein